MSRSILKSFQKTVAVAGTAEALSATSIFTKAFVIKGISGNTQSIYVGDSTVDNTGFGLGADESVRAGDIESQGWDTTWDLSKVFIDADVNGEGVMVLYQAEES